MNVISGIEEVMNGGGGFRDSVALVRMVFPVESVVVKPGQVVVVNSVTPVVMVFGPCDAGPLVGAWPPDVGRPVVEGPITSVEIHQTDTVIGGRVIVVV
jgi:hypothetical protein